MNILLLIWVRGTTMALGASQLEREARQSFELFQIVVLAEMPTESEDKKRLELAACLLLEELEWKRIEEKRIEAFVKGRGNKRGNEWSLPEKNARQLAPL